MNRKLKSLVMVMVVGFGTLGIRSVVKADTLIKPILEHDMNLDTYGIASGKYNTGKGVLDYSLAALGSGGTARSKYVSGSTTVRAYIEGIYGGYVIAGTNKAATSNGGTAEVSSTANPIQYMNSSHTTTASGSNTKYCQVNMNLKNI